MKYAFIENNIVKEVFTTSPYQLFAKAYADKFVECPDYIVQGWTLIDGIYNPPPVQPIFVPESVSMRQARLALLSTGLLDTVNSIVAGLTGDSGKAAKIEWEYSSVVMRNKGLVRSVQQVLGLTDQQLDDLFIAASLIN